MDVDLGSGPVLRGVDWEVARSDRWAVLGPNGSGKTTMLALASGFLHPSAGTVEILGQRLGRVDVRRLRQDIGLVSTAVAKMLVPTLSASDVVVSARHGALEPWWHHYDSDDRARARSLLAEAGFADIAERQFGVLSDGERQQVLLARCLMASPSLLLLDEPAAGLDLAGRERLLGRLESLAYDEASAPMVMISHHVEEIPRGFDHVLLLRAGEVVAAGPITSVMTAATLSDTFGLALRLSCSGGRWTVRAA